MDPKMGVFGGLTVKLLSTDLPVLDVDRNWAWAADGVRVAAKASQKKYLGILPTRSLFS